MSRRRFLGLGAGAAVVGGGAATAAWGTRWDLEVSRVTVSIRDLPDALDGFTIGHVTDTHQGLFVPVEFVEKAVAAVNAAGPDLICLTGDYFTRCFGAMVPGARALGKLSAPDGRTAVLGNHDHGAKTGRVVDALRDEAGARVVRNEWISVARDGATIHVIGLDDPVRGHHDLNAATDGLPEDGPTVLLAHTPDVAFDAAARGIDLVLAGHTRGGQVRFPLIGPPFTNSRYGQRLVAGLNRVRDTAIYTNRRRHGRPPPATELPAGGGPHHPPPRVTRPALGRPTTQRSPCSASKIGAPTATART